MARTLAKYQPRTDFGSIAKSALADAASLQLQAKKLPRLVKTSYCAFMQADPDWSASADPTYKKYREAAELLETSLAQLQSRRYPVRHFTVYMAGWLCFLMSLSGPLRNFAMLAWIFLARPVANALEMGLNSWAYQRGLVRLAEAADQLGDQLPPVALSPADRAPLLLQD